MSLLIKLLLTVYVISILTWSGLVKAEEVVLDTAGFDQKHFELSLRGRVTGACGVSLKTKIIENQFTEDGPIALIEVLNQNKATNCPLDRQVELFDIVIDVRSLGLKPNTTYGLAFVNSFKTSNSPIYNVEIPDNSIFPSYTPTNISGVLTTTQEGQWIVVKDMNNFVKLKTKLDLSKYLGQYVVVEGTEVLHRTGPIYEIGEHNPLRANESQEGPTMFLFSISTVTY